ncbi:Osmotically-inducible protein OsmY, contains BON domain [Bradyrhizobium lablabi]|jgi:osmotically-inducible protein OsmY|uniref:Osmotically-inducible protein OsmY, contains BON domain n=3 Tax=Nitrobacteraceae TaxID=41294 RepID=A0ABY0PBK9_9BRAD|nr:Osmotically-inducible protein OsmY, contains BON domain [Bradyrhizobium ottawaense]SED89856.1 Osmotically-inducible protein OsmY, contains BON domain [Bradyrhizobium lablabi]SHL86347.1 Osmotically-inducible protein OsmY, contains BON domain [Bradyrhizobium lablabi]
MALPSSLNSGYGRNPSALATNLTVTLKAPQFATRVDSLIRTEVPVMKTDTELRQDVEKGLAWNSRVDAGHITVTARNRVVTLAGRVQSYATKCEAGSVVKHIAGVAGLANDLEVTPEGTQPNDADLTQSVLQALEANVFVPSKTIKPVVHDGWVTLSGKVLYYYEKLDAENAVRPLRGVKGITDSVVIDNPDGPQGLSQEIIADALSRNARLDTDRITVKVNGRTVVLEGAVRCLAERDEAEQAAWAAPGVSTIENHLAVS